MMWLIVQVCAVYVENKIELLWILTRSIDLRDLLFKRIRK